MPASYRERPKAPPPAALLPGRVDKLAYFRPEEAVVEFLLTGQCGRGDGYLVGLRGLSVQEDDLSALQADQRPAGMPSHSGPFACPFGRSNRHAQFLGKVYQFTKLSGPVHGLVVSLKLPKFSADLLSGYAAIGFRTSPEAMPNRGSQPVVTSQAMKAETNTEQLARLQAEVQLLREQLSRAQSLATVGTMTAMVAHEFNNILTPIINYAQMARKNPAFVDKALTRAAEGGIRATSICQALLGVTSKPSAKPSRIELAGLIEDTLEAMVRRPEKDSIDLRTDVPAGLTLATRPVQLQQVLLNLLINARTAVLASNATREITISAEQTDAQTVIRVADNGVGIAPEDLERIFQPFFSTAADAQDGPSGHGLGLAFCRKIAADLGGDISVESSPGRGATFTLRLPS